MIPTCPVCNGARRHLVMSAGLPVFARCENCTKFAPDPEDDPMTDTIRHSPEAERLLAIEEPALERAIRGD